MENDRLRLYEAMFRRKSTRRFLPDALPAEQLARIVAFTKGMRPLDQGIATRVELATAADVRGMVAAKAPHYLLLYSQRADGYLPNAGFLLQQADLYLSSLGLGSCWLGMAKTTAPAKDGLDYVIMLAFGAAREGVYRESAAAFTRKAMPEIASGEDDRLEAVRLAPSAGNSQPWYFVVGEGCLYVYRKKLGLIKLYETMNQIDMGIALCHLWLASEHQGRPFSFEPGAQGAPEAPGYTCIGKAR